MPEVASAGSRPEVVTLGETMLGLRIPAPRLAPRVAGWDLPGSESNVARNLVGLGHRAAWVSALGDDAHGTLILSAIEAEGVDVSHVWRPDVAPTGLMLRPQSGTRADVTYYRHGSAASLMSVENVDLEFCASAEILHLTGITLALSESCRHLVEVLLEQDMPGTLKSFDVNWRSALWGSTAAADVLLRAARKAQVVFVGLDEAAALWNVDTPKQVRDLLSATDLLLVTDGADGAYGFRAGAEAFMPALNGPVVDPIGAGDAFAAGVLSGVLGAKTLEELLRSGHALAGATVASSSDVRVVESK